MKALQLLAVGNLEHSLMLDVAPVLAEVFCVPVRILPAPLDPEFAFHRERQQYHSSEVLRRMQPYVGPDSWRVLGITPVDLYIPILTFVFGEAQMGGPCAVVSVHRLRQQFYGLDSDDDLLRSRLAKEAVHEVGHTLDLTHCQDYTCAMAPSHAVEWIDIKQAGLCGACAARLGSHFQTPV